MKKLSNKYHTDAASLHKEMNRLLDRNQEIDDTFLSLYTDKSKGILTEQRFLKLTIAMENEQKEKFRVRVGCDKEYSRIAKVSITR